MKYDTVEMNSGRIYCPSTDEVIMTLDELAPVKEDAKALIALWHSEIIDQPTINDEKIRKDWEEYLDKFDEETRYFDLYEKLFTFLEEYEAPDWRVYQIETSGMACGPVSSTVWYVVLADTVIEGNDLDEESI